MKLITSIIIIIIMASCIYNSNSIKNYDFNTIDFKNQLRNQLSSKTFENKENAIKNIKLYNTILFYNLKNDSVYKFFKDYFEMNEIKIISKLRCGYGLGMTTVCEDSLNIGSYYSRKSIYRLDIEPPHDGRERILKDSSSAADK
jgi:hypothetical protein